MNEDAKLLVLESLNYFIARLYTQLSRIEERSGKDSIVYKRLLERYERYETSKKQFIDFLKMQSA